MAADQKVADAGLDYAAGFDAYVIGLFGQPDAAAPWMLQFGGHHLGLNVIFAGAPRLDAIRASLGDTCFAWSGPTKHEAGANGESYFRIHGPSLLIEHAPQGNQDGYKVHVHTVMLNLQNDYGRLLV